MGIGFTSKSEPELEEEYVPLYETIIECPMCGDKELMKLDQGTCACENIEIGCQDSIADHFYRPRHHRHTAFFKTVSYKEEAPLIYDVLLDQELP